MHNTELLPLSTRQQERVIYPIPTFPLRRGRETIGRRAWRKPHDPGDGVLRLTYRIEGNG